MPLSCSDFRKKVKTKKVYFLLFRQGGTWRFYIETEATGLLGKGTDNSPGGLLMTSSVWSS